MGAFLSYSIISGLLLLAMYLAYRLFLARDNQHSFNRGVLLLIYLVSFATLPSIRIFENLSTHTKTQTLVLDGVVSTAGTPLSTPIWGTVLIWIFMVGTIVVSLKTIITWVRLTNVIRSGKKITQNGYTLVITDNKNLAPFSWMHYVVISNHDYDNNCSAIASHELKHVESRHWIDLLIAQIICIINWFNPVAWLMRDELMLVHEYQADMAVINSGHNPQEYQILLIKKAVGARFPSLANSLNHSKLKKRITMMYKEKSGAGRKFKALALVPMFALALGVTAVPAVRAAVSTISSSKVSKNQPQNQDANSVRSFKITDLNNNGNKTTIVVKGENLGNHLTVSGGSFTTAGKTYYANSLNCDMSDGNATIIATFPFLSKFKDTSMTLTVDGEVIPFDLENFLNSAQSVVVGNSSQSTSSTSPTIVISGNSSSIPSNMTIYLDGEEISESNIKKLETDKIASITVDRQNNAIRITSRK